MDTFSGQVANALAIQIELNLQMNIAVNFAIGCGLWPLLGYRKAYCYYSLTLEYKIYRLALEIILVNYTRVPSTSAETLLKGLQFGQTY